MSINMMANVAISAALERIASKDKDFRYMGTSDLLTELQKENFKVDGDMERRLCQVTLQQLDDASGDISALAVKCLSSLVKKVNDSKVVDIFESLVSKLLKGNERQRDVASIAMKTIIAEAFIPSISQTIVSVLSPKLINGLDSPETSVEKKSECLDILSDIFQKYGNIMSSDHNRLLSSLLNHLNSSKIGFRKRTIQALTSLSYHLSDDLLSQAISNVLNLLQSKDAKSEMTKSNIQLIASICRIVGFRMGIFLNQIFPLLSNYCKNASENDEELREYSLQALESFVLRCPRDVSPHVNSILDLCLDLISFDPNFTDDMEEDDDDEVIEEEDDNESEDEYSDDEDVSWKVRKASARCLSAIINSRPEMISLLFEKASPKLIERFREREENVKVDVFNAYIDLLRQTDLITKGNKDVYLGSPLYLLEQEIPKIVKSINKQLREKSLKTKVGCFSVLKEVVIVLPHSIADHMPLLVSGIENALTDKTSNSNLKIEVLIFTRLVIASNPQLFHPHMQKLFQPILLCVSERYYKVTAEAIRVCEEIVRALRPNIDKETFDFRPYVHPLYATVSKRLVAQDQDLEVKECVISCMGLMISMLGDELKNELSVCLPLLLERLKNEITRLTSVKTFAIIAESKLKVDISLILEPSVIELTSFLRKANRVLKQSSISTLNSLTVAYSDIFSPSLLSSIINELPPLISDADLAISALALELCMSILNSNLKFPKVASEIISRILPQALTLVKSSLLQGQPLITLQQFFGALVTSRSIGFEELLHSLLSIPKSQPKSTPLTKQSFSSISKCIAVLCFSTTQSNFNSTVSLLVSNLNSKSELDTCKLLSLLSLGEIGRQTDLSLHADLEKVVVSSLESTSDEIKSAASYALGSIAVGNHVKYLPFILKQIDTNSKIQYLLLHSLKEVISRQTMEGGKEILRGADVDKVLQLLFTHCQSEEEGVRNVVAECLGKLSLIEPSKLIPALIEKSKSSSAFTRTTIIFSLKFSIVDFPQPIDDAINPNILSFLMLINDEDKHVRRAAVIALSTFAHNKPNLIYDLLPQLLPLLYDQMKVKEELIRTVSLGPFKHKIDDGLELRKSAFDCIDILLSTCLHCVDCTAFISPHLISGLEDDYDVKMPCHLILSKLAEKCSPAVIASLSPILDALEKTIKATPRADAVKQEVERNEDMIRSALRAVHSLTKISNIESNVRFKTFMNNVIKTGSIEKMYEAIRQEHNTIH